MATAAIPNLEPKSLIRPTHWSREVENAYRYQLAGYRDEFEYKRLRQVTEVKEEKEKNSPFDKNQDEQFVSFFLSGRHLA